MATSRTGTGNIQEEPEALCSARKWGGAPEKPWGWRNSEGHCSQLRPFSVARARAIWAKPTRKHYVIPQRGSVWVHTDMIIKFKKGVRIDNSAENSKRAMWPLGQQGEVYSALLHDPLPSSAWEEERKWPHVTWRCLSRWPRVPSKGSKSLEKASIQRVEGLFPPVSLKLKTHLITQITWDKSNWGAFFRTTNNMLPSVTAEKLKGSLRHCHSPAESRELLWKLKGRWYPGTEQGHLAKTKKTWIVMDFS